MTEEPIRLHLGCFNKKIHGFINVDVRSEVNPDLVDDVINLTKIENNSISYIYCCHCAEHFSRKDALKAFKRWYDVLKDNGVLRIAVPDLEACFEYYNYTKDLRILQNLLYGSQLYKEDFHLNGWDFKTLKEDLEYIGFKNIKRYDWRETEHYYIDDYSASYLPQISYNTRRVNGKIEGKLVSLNIEAVK